MAGLSDVMPKLIAVLASVPGIETVYRYVPETPGQDGPLPEAILDVMPPQIGGGKARTRRVDWPIDIWIRTEIRPVEVAEAFERIEAYPDAVIAALDSAGTFDGVLATTVGYDVPAVSHPSGGAFGVTRDGGDTQYVETCVHAIFTVDRVGGFANG